MTVSVIFCHEVAIVLPGAGRQALSFSRNHDHSSFGGSIADSTGYVMLEQVVKWTTFSFIFCSM